MKTNSRRLALAVLSAALAMSACAPGTRMEAVHAKDYVARPGRIYVLTGGGMGWGSEFVQGFRQEFSTIVRACGSVAGYGDVSGLELDQNAPMQKAAAFHPDMLLNIAHGGGVVDTNGSRLSIGYDAILSDWSQRRTVWRANFSFLRGSPMIPQEERGAVFAVDLTNGLKRDGLLKGCSPIKLQQGNRFERDGKDGNPPPTRPRSPEAGDSPPERRPGVVPMSSLENLLPGDDHAR